MFDIWLFLALFDFLFFLLAITTNNDACLVLNYATLLHLVYMNDIELKFIMILIYFHINVYKSIFKPNVQIHIFLLEFGFYSCFRYNAIDK